MSDTIDTEMRIRLEDELSRLTAAVAEIDASERESLSEASGENSYRDHMADQGSATFERELDLSLEQNERDELAEVRVALDRLNAGTYRTCSRCGAEIPVARLRAVPTAKLCVQCKEIEESR
ncbi:MAG: TraR/DksA family transcriptional regulator [Coriobacteriia bacterium]|nr:TraR/DksA family transcriptional regulator [Coriobacteriia bacterium]